MKTLDDLEYLLKQIEETGAANFVDPINWRKFGPLLVKLARAAEHYQACKHEQADRAARVPEEGMTCYHARWNQSSCVAMLFEVLAELEAAKVYPEYRPYGT